ncbi:MAG: hypothetical protein EAX96_07785 [Candidatus Lokiarchaeota archaeon]|nr:hypothetical protein [Candidatus Lokiarchaeota archaeon]
MTLKLMEKLRKSAEEESARIKTNPEIWQKVQPTFFANLEIGRSLEQASNFIFDPIGLILMHPLKTEEYESTPRNSSAFARTGGDGVHFSLLHLDGQIIEKSPVVMTVPDNYGEENLIVGSSLYEFLCLGSRTGYFLLEGLTYSDRRKETLEYLEHPEALVKEDSQVLNKENIKRSQYLLQLLRDSLSLHPWRNIENRLSELQSFQKLLDLPSKERK